MKGENGLLKAVPQQSEAIRRLWPEALRSDVCRYDKRPGAYVFSYSADDLVWIMSGVSVSVMRSRPRRVVV